MRQRIVYLIAGLFLLCSHTAATNYEKQIQRHPGNTELYCAWIDQLLQQGDTATAEEKIAYVRKMNTSAPCVYIRQAELEWHRGYTQRAAMCYADIICLGYDPTDDILFARIVQRESTLLQTTLQHRLLSTKYPDAVKAALAMLTPRQSQDTLSTAAPDTTATPDTLYCTLHYTRRGKLRELYGQVNGLRVKLVIDSTSNQASISWVEGQFLYKNDYIRESDILQGRKEVLLREVDLGEGLILHQVRTLYATSQEEPIILPLKLLEQLGRVEMDDTKSEIRIYKPINTINTTL